jgi:hypothetical protein
VTINAYEVAFALPAIGDKVVLEFEEDAPYYWTCLHVGEPFVPRERFYEVLRKGKTLVVSHDGSWTPGICDADEHVEELMPVAQVSTTHTRDHFAEFERYVPEKSNRGPAYERWQDALARGFKYGAVGGSDSHNRAPQIRTGLFLRELTREEIYEALKARRCFAVTPCRIALDFRVNDCFMGSIVRGESEINRLVMAKVAAPSSIATVAIVKNNVDVFSHRSGKEHDWIEWPDPSAPGPGEYYYLRVTLENGHMAWSSPVWFE